jgi:hypothetical protein
MPAQEEMHIGLVVDAGDILVVQRLHLPEYEGLDPTASYLPGGMMTPADYGPASALQRNILAQTGFYTHISKQPIFHWKQREDCTQNPMRYSLWSGILGDHPRMPISDETISNSGLVALRGLSPLTAGRIQMKHFREIIREAHGRKYEYS